MRSGKNDSVPFSKYFKSSKPVLSPFNDNVLTINGSSVSFLGNTTLEVRATVFYNFYIMIIEAENPP